MSAIKEAYKAGFSKGWQQRGEFIQDYRTAHNDTAAGVALMLLGSLAVLCILGLALITPVNVAGAIQAGAIAGAVGVAGYFIHRVEAKSYRKRQAAFKNKWEVE